jgi:hypothetical protein
MWQTVAGALLAELHVLQDRLTDLPRYERIVLDLAACLVEELEQIQTGMLPERVTKIDSDTYVHDLPGGSLTVGIRSTGAHAGCAQSRGSFRRNGLSVLHRQSEPTPGSASPSSSARHGSRSTWRRHKPPGS